MPSAVAVARDARIGRGRAFDEIMPAPVARFFVFLNVEVNCEDSYRLGHNEGKSTEVEGPAVVVLVLAVLVFLVAGIARVAGDVDDDSDDVAQAWRRRCQMVTMANGHRTKGLDSVALFRTLMLRLGALQSLSLERFQC